MKSDHLRKDQATEGHHEQTHQERTYGDNLIGYSERITLRREQCDMMAESQTPIVGK
jgi:hypothetical protein